MPGDRGFCLDRGFCSSGASDTCVSGSAGQSWTRSWPGGRAPREQTTTTQACPSGRVQPTGVPTAGLSEDSTRCPGLAHGRCPRAQARPQPGGSGRTRRPAPGPPFPAALRWITSLFPAGTAALWGPGPPKTKTCKLGDKDRREDSHGGRRASLRPRSSTSALPGFQDWDLARGRRGRRSVRGRPCPSSGRGRRDSQTPERPGLACGLRGLWTVPTGLQFHEPRGLSWHRTRGAVTVAPCPWHHTCGGRRGQRVVLLLFHELQGHGAEVAFVLNHKVTQSHHQLLPGEGTSTLTWGWETMRALHAGATMEKDGGQTVLGTGKGAPRSTQHWSTQRGQRRLSKQGVRITASKNAWDTWRGDC